MHPLLTFASGIVAGIIGIRLMNKAAPPTAQRLEGLGDKARQGLSQARSGLRDATVSGLSAIEKSSASLRSRLSPVVEEPAKPARAPRPRKTAKPKAKAPVPAAGDDLS